MSALVSVIIPVWNQENLIIKCLNSIPCDKRVEIIVVDDNSTDNTLNVLLHYRKRKLKIYHLTENKGPGNARNIGIAQATGDYIVMIDSDDYVNTNQFVNILDNFLHKDYDIFYVRKIKPDGFTWHSKWSLQGDFIKRSFIGDTKHSFALSAEDIDFATKIRAKNPKTLDVIGDMFYYYNKPRQNSLSWNATNKIDSREYIDSFYNSVSMYWYRDKYGNNAGDIFGPWLLDNLGVEYRFSNRPNFISVGSILNYGYENTKVWGSGLHNAGELIKVKKDNIYALRGKLSRERVGADCVVGDPGLLLSKYYKPEKEKKYKFGIVSHYVDYDTFKNINCDSVKVISMLGEPNATYDEAIKNIADQLSECEFIFSSSLHGIIFSHSLGIPAIHLENKPLFSKNNFKFRDYYSVYDNLEYTKEVYKGDLNFVYKYLAEPELYKPSEEEVKNIQDNLLEVFQWK